MVIVTALREGATQAYGSCSRRMGCTQGGPGEIMLELRPLRGKQEEMVSQAEGTVCAKAMVLEQDMD